MQSLHRIVTRRTIWRTTGKIVPDPIEHYLATLNRIPDPLLVEIAEEGVQPFDLIFQDGSKQLYMPLLDKLIGLLRRGGLLMTDNVLWDGEVVPNFRPNSVKVDG